MATKSKADNPVARFESSMKELESLVEQLESGEQELDITLKLFERGMELSKTCRQALDTAELRIRELSAAPGAADSTSDDD